MVEAAVTDKLRGFIPEEIYVQVVKQTLKDILGDSATSSTIYHLGGDEALQDSKAFEMGLKAFFGPGAETILKLVLENLGKAVDMGKCSNKDQDQVGASELPSRNSA